MGVGASAQEPAGSWIPGHKLNSRFSNVRDSDPRPRSRPSLLFAVPQHLMHGAGRWHGNCLTSVCMRIAFDKLHQSGGSKLRFVKALQREGER